MVQKGYWTQVLVLRTVFDLQYWGYLCSFPDCRKGAAGDDGVYNVSHRFA